MKKENNSIQPEINSKVVEWAKKRGLLCDGTIPAQVKKVQEELSETIKAIMEDDVPEIADGIGDLQVTIIILAEMLNLNAYACLNGAYDVIKGRQGRIIDGSFVKER